MLTAAAALVALVWAVGGSVMSWTRTESGAEGQRDAAIAVLQDEMKSKADAGVLEVKIETLRTEIQADETQEKQDSEQIAATQKSLDLLLAYARRPK